MPLRRLYVGDIQFGGKDDITDIAPTPPVSATPTNAPQCTAHSRLAQGRRPSPLDAALKEAMLAIRYGFNIKDEIQLVSKEDILSDNPNADLDSLDALCLTFGGPIAASAGAGGDYPETSLVVTEWDPFDLLEKELAA